jgi:hypothetical protein
MDTVFSSWKFYIVRIVTLLHATTHLQGNVDSTVRGEDLAVATEEPPNPVNNPQGEVQNEEWMVCNLSTSLCIFIFHVTKSRIATPSFLAGKHT